MGESTYRVIFRSVARDEAVEAAEYIAEHSSIHTALAWYEGLEATINSLSIHPHLCSYAREASAFKNVELRQIVFKSHRVIFSVIGREVHVLHIRHAARENLEIP